MAVWVIPWRGWHPGLNLTKKSPGVRGPPGGWLAIEFLAARPGTRSLEYSGLRRGERCETVQSVHRYVCICFIVPSAAEGE